MSNALAPAAISPAPASLPTRQLLLLYGTLTAGLLVVYLPAIRGGFIWDDDDYVTNNATLRNGHGLVAIWTEPRATPQYYPLVHTSFWIEYRLWGLHPLGYHVVNVLLHATGTLLAWLVLRRLRVPGAALAAALFAFHPIQVESVAWITERKNTLSACFYFAAALAVLRYADSPNCSRGPYRPLLLGYVLFAAALLSKSVTCTLPAAILVILWWREAITKRIVLALLPMFVMGAAYGVLTIWLERAHVGAEGQEWQFSATEHLIMAGRIFWFYPMKVVWPDPLAFIYPRWDIDATDVLAWSFPGAAAALVIGLAAASSRLGRGPAAGVLLYAGTLFPALGFINVYPMRFSFVADHFSYLATLPLFALAAALARRAAYRLPRPAGTAAAALLVVILGTLTFRQSRHYSSLETLWRYNIAAAPTAWMPYSNLGTLLASRGDLEAGMRLFGQALALNPGYAEAHYNLGTAHLRLGNLLAAEASLQRAVTIDPNLSDAHLNLGHVLLETGRGVEAMASLKRAVELAGPNAETLVAIGRAADQAGKAESAIESYRDAMRLDPHHVPAYYYAGLNRLSAGDLQAAKEYLARVVSATPDDVDARVALATVFSRVGRPAETIRLLAPLVALNKPSANASALLGMAHLQIGERQTALRHLGDALTAAPDHLEALNSSAWIHATAPESQLRSGVEAVRLAERLHQLSGGQHPYYLDTLAAAYAEAGQFERAFSIIGRALQTSSSVEAPRLTQMRQRERLYRQNRPWRDGADVSE